MTHEVPAPYLPASFAPDGDATAATATSNWPEPVRRVGGVQASEGSSSPEAIQWLSDPSLSAKSSSHEHFADIDRSGDLLDRLWRAVRLRSSEVEL